MDGSGHPRRPRHKPKLKKLRLLLVLVGLGVLAVISTVFGMLMAVASDLPSLENKAEYRAAQNSLLYFDDPDDPACKDFGTACELASLTGNQNRVLLDEDQISPFIKNAVIAIEDQRFYEHRGVDYKGIAPRAGPGRASSSAPRRARSTITQQFVKNALSAQSNRSVFQKLREAALAYHLERKWTKQKILTQYLNTVYFGSGRVRRRVRDADVLRPRRDRGVGPAPGASRARARRPRHRPPRRGGRAARGDDRLADDVRPGPEPEQRDRAPQHRAPAHARAAHDLAARVPRGAQNAGPDRREVTPPRPDSDQPYFSSWVTQQLVDRYRPGVVFGGGLKIRTTIDPTLQAAAEQAIAGRLGAIGPASSLVAIENKTGEIKAMVGGADFDQRPFNLAVNGHRQPGSSIKPFILVARSPTA